MPTHCDNFITFCVCKTLLAGQLASSSSVEERRDCGGEWDENDRWLAYCFDTPSFVLNWGERDNKGLDDLEDIWRNEVTLMGLM